MTGAREREIDSRLADWVDGTLTGKDRERFLAELRVNPQLRKDLAEYERTVATVREALQAETVKVDLADRVLATIADAEKVAAAQRAARRVGPFTLPQFAAGVLRRKTVLWSLASAAALLAVALVLSTWPSGPTVEMQATGAAGAEPPKSLDEFLATNDPAAPPPAAPAPAVPVPQPPGETLAVTEKLEKGKVGEQRLAGGRDGAESKPAGPEAPRSEPSVGAARVDAPGAKSVHEEAAAPPPAAATSELEKRQGAPVGAHRNEASRDLTEQVTEEPAARFDRAIRDQSSTAPVGRTKDVEADDRAAGRSQYGARSANPPAATTERLALVLLQGDATDGTERPVGPDAGLAPVAGSTGAAKDRSAGTDKAPSAEQLLDAFLGSQMRIEPAPGTKALVLAPPATLRLRAVDADEAKKQDSAPAGGAGGLPAVERTWLVEGSKEEVESVLRRLAAFAKARNLVLTTGESVVALPAADPAAAAPGDAKTVDRAEAAPKAESDRKPPAAERRLLLRFRLLRR